MNDHEWLLENKRKWTALKIAIYTGYDVEEILKILQDLKIHGNWTDEELKTRPANIEELADIVAEYIEEED